MRLKQQTIVTNTVQCNSQGGPQDTSKLGVQSWRCLSLTEKQPVLESILFSGVLEERGEK